MAYVVNYHSTRSQRLWGRNPQLPHPQPCSSPLEHLDTLTSMDNLAATYQYQGRCGEAEKLHLQVMQKSKEVLESEHPDTLIRMANIVSAYWH